MRKLADWIRRHELGLLLALLGLLLLLAYLGPSVFVFVGPGERGVLWRRFFGGTEVTTVYGEGTHLIFPWDVMTVYDTRVRALDQTFEALALNGLSVGIEVTARFRPDRQRLGLLHRDVGPNYTQVVLVPEIGAAVRLVVARYLPEDLYTADRQKLQREVVSLAKSETLERNVFLDDVQIRNVRLPGELGSAIEDKLEEQQHAQQYVFILARERQEAERKRIEAAGIRDFQQIVTNGISEEYLEWKGIDATLKLAESPNAKVVIFGSSANGLPIILNTEATASPSGRSAAPARPPAPAPTVTPPP